MRRLFMWLLAAGLLLAVPAASLAAPSIGQVLVREGDYAIRLSSALGVGTTDNEAEAESNLTSLGIAPRNGWISDYPVTPDIIADLQTQVEAAAVAGRFLPTGKDDAVRAFVTLNTELGLNFAPAASGQGVYTSQAGPDPGNVDPGYVDQPAPAYPDQAAQETYYQEAPPVVTYYAPPPDYAYLYNWNPFPFFFGGVLFPGFFVLADFSIALFNNPFIFTRAEFIFFRNHHFHNHHFISNHFRDHDGHFARFDHGRRFDGRHDGRFDGRHDGRHDGMSGSRFEGRNGGFDRDSASRIVSRDMNRRGDFGRAREGAVRSGEGQVRRSWSGSSMPSRTDRGFRTESRGFDRPSGVTGRSFGGGSFRSVPSARSFGGDRSFSGGRSFGGERAMSRGFGGGRSFSAPSMGSRSFGGGRSFSAPSMGSRSFSGGSRSFGGGHSFGGSRSFGGGGHSFGGGRSFGGGGGHFGGFGGGHRGR